MSVGRVNFKPTYYFALQQKVNPARKPDTIIVDAKHIPMLEYLRDRQ